MKYLKSYEHITYEMAEKLSKKEIKALYVKDYTNAVNRLNKMFNTLGFKFYKDNECAGLSVNMDLTSIEGSVMNSILDKHSSEFGVFPGDQRYNFHRSIEILTKGEVKRKTKVADSGGRFRIEPTCDDDIINDVCTRLLSIFNSYKFFSVYGWPRTGIVIKDYLNKLIKNCLYIGCNDYETNSYELTKEDAIEIYKDITSSENAFKVLKNIKKDIPELWNILKQFVEKNEIDMGTEMGELGF